MNKIKKKNLKLLHLQTPPLALPLFGNATFQGPSFVYLTHDLSCRKPDK